jgi:exocyst complex component 4
LFRFGETDLRAVTVDIKVVDESIHHTLKASVPGLVAVQPGELASSLDEGLTSGKHRNLIPANAFNVTILFQPTVAFIERASSIAPSGFEEEPKAFGLVLEDFVQRVFLPQLDERVTTSFQTAISGYDAYQVDRRPTLQSDKPPLKSSVRVMALIHSLCFMLQTTPFHRENYSRLIVGVIVQYYQQCSARFRGGRYTMNEANLVELVCQSALAVNAVDPALALPATWAQREDVISSLTDVRAVTARCSPSILVASLTIVRGFS